MKIRLIEKSGSEREDYHRMRFALWPHHGEKELRDEMELILRGKGFYRNELSWTVLVAVRENGALGGFIEIAIYPELKAYEESPIGYIEGWFVDADLRNQGVGRQLVQAAEKHVRKAGCKAIASDVEHENQVSHKAHAALGFVRTHADKEVIFYYKRLIETEGKVMMVRVLSRGDQESMGRTIQTVGRPLEATIYRWEFLDGESDEVLKELSKFQNPDGGFGQGLESDFQLPDSSPMATSVGLRILLELPQSEWRDKMLDQAFTYLEEAYDSERGGWYIVPANVMEYPHAPWWSILEATGHTAMDESWGNPSAELLSQFVRGERKPDSFDLNKQILHAILNLEEKEHYESEHELYCYLPLYDVLEGELKARLGKVLLKAVQEVVQLEEAKWEEYVPMPLHFAQPNRKNQFGIQKEDIERQLNWLVCKMEKDGGWSPPWGESFYQEGMKRSYHEWIGVLTLKAMRWLRDYDRLEEE